MSSMAEVIARHINVYDDYEDGANLAVCGCGYETPFSGPYDPDAGGRAHAQHVAAELTKAGFGNMADAWDEGWAHYRKWFTPVDPEFGINPYRGAGHE